MGGRVEIHLQAPFWRLWHLFKPRGETNRNRKPQSILELELDWNTCSQRQTAIPGASRLAARDHKVLLQQPGGMKFETLAGVAGISLAMLRSGQAYLTLRSEPKL